VGTSLPELITALVAGFQKVPSISVGNILGSNVFNILFVVGMVTLIRPISVKPSFLRFEYLVMFLFNVVLFFIMRTHYTITRREGALLFLGYIAFIVFLFV
jgi:cation:H+ antiporter